MEISKRAIIIKLYDEDEYESITLDGRKFLRELIDVVWQHIWEDESVPATSTADELINKAIESHGKISD